MKWSGVGEWSWGGLMHVTGGTLQLEQTELTATQLDTNAAGGKKIKGKEENSGVFTPSQVTRLKGTFARLCVFYSGAGMFHATISKFLPRKMIEASVVDSIFYFFFLFFFLPRNSVLDSKAHLLVRRSRRPRGSPRTRPRNPTLFSLLRPRSKARLFGSALYLRSGF